MHLILGDEELATRFMEKMERDQTSLSTCSIYQELASNFFATYKNGGLTMGCEMARQFIRENADEILTSLGSATFGYWNPDYSPEDMCPWD